MSTNREEIRINPRLKKQDILYQLVRDLARSSDVHTIADHLFKRARSFLGAEYGLLMLADREGATLQGIDGYGLDPEMVRWERINIQEELAPVTLAFQKKQPVVISNMPQQAGLSERLRKKYPFVHDAWAVPLMNGEKAIGALVLGYGTSREATADDLHLLQLLGDEAALAIERAHLTEELRQSEAQYRELVENARDVIMSISLEGIFTRINPAAETLLGWTPAEMLGRHYSKFLTPASAAAMAERERRLAEGEKVSSIYEVEALHKDGRVIPLESHSRLLRDQTGAPSSILIIHRDIRERKQAEAIIQEEGDVAKALARVSQELSASLKTPVLLDRLCHLTAEVLDADYSHTRLLQPQDNTYAIVAGYGETPEQAEARRAFRVPAKRFTQLFARLKRDGIVERATEDLRDPVEQSILQRLRIATVLYLPLYHNGEIVGVQSVWYRKGATVHSRHRHIARGISRIASLALANALLFQELERANQLKEEFIGSVSHELRTPIHIIMGYVELLQDQTFGPLNDDQTHTLQRINHSTKELLDLINTILDLSRLQSRQGLTVQQQVDISSLFADLETDVRQLAPHSSVTIDWRLHRDLPTLRTDPIKLRMILKNLLTNALKFTERGSVIVSADRRDDNLVLSVHDTGIGIAPEALPYIFEPFRQADSSSMRSTKGVGLGLYIVRQLVELLGGNLSVTSTLGKGSTFQVTLPLQHEQR
jgi:PAS domain S-box-containing protein